MAEPILDVEFVANPKLGLFDRLTELTRGNIAQKSIVKLTSSGNIENQLPQLLDENPTSYILTPLSKGNQFLLIDFKDRKFQLTRYFLKTGPFPSGLFHMKSWKLEGSNDNENFTLLDTQKGNPDLNDYEKEYLSAPVNCPEPFRYYRLIVTKNWYNNRRLLLTKIEFFGKLYGSPVKNVLAESLNYTSEHLESLRSLFVKIDSNKNGQLEPEELKSFFEKVVMLPVSLVPIAFRVCDADNDGSIDFDEFAKFYRQLQTLQSPNPMPAYEMLFNALDIDNRHSLNRNDIKKFAEFIGIEITDEDLAQLFIELDTNSDGRLSFDELQIALKINAYKNTTFNVFRDFNESETESLKKQFNAFDKDGNGHLTPDELAQFCGEKNAELMFMVYDTDNSGTITFDEFVDFGKKYISMIQNSDNQLQRSIFDSLDEDKCGALNKQQLTKFFDLINVDIKSEELDEFIASHDSDKDGKVTFEEAKTYQCD